MTVIESEQIAESAVKANTALGVWSHIVERRIEYLVGTLIAYQLGLLDTMVTYGSQCIA